MAQLSTNHIQTALRKARACFTVRRVGVFHAGYSWLVLGFRDRELLRITISRHFSFKGGISIAILWDFRGNEYRTRKKKNRGKFEALRA